MEHRVRPQVPGRWAKIGIGALLPQSLAKGPGGRISPDYHRHREIS